MQNKSQKRKEQNNSKHPQTNNQVHDQFDQIK